MAEVKHEEVFNCTPQQMFDLLKDYEKYGEFLKEVKSCKVLQEKNGEKYIEYKITVMKDIIYLNSHSENPEKKELYWKFLKGDLFKSMSGSWRLEEAPGGKTKAYYQISAEFGMLVPSFAVKTAISVNLPAMMQAYHKRVGDLYGK